jgi:DNA-binding GntR family transcriptional regulator
LHTAAARIASSAWQADEALSVAKLFRTDAARVYAAVVARRPPPASRAAPLRGARTTRSAADSAAADAPHGSRPEQVYLRLRDLIVQGLLAPGSRVVETEVAARLGVSRTPVREALQRLQQEGFVVGAPGAQQARLTVAPLTRTDVNELLNIVGELEGLGARWAAGLPVAERHALTRALKALNAEFYLTGRTLPIDHGRLYEADERLHRTIVDAGSGPRLVTLHDSVKPQAERYIRMYISMLTSDIRVSVAEHDAIIDAIHEGKADEAQGAVQLNWRHAADRIAKVIDVAGERGSW